MFYYFGYGSNMSVISLRAKGVEPLSSEPAVLEGWRLTFDIPDFFAIEGGTGNLEAVQSETVHGVLHGCRRQDLATLDQLEALGITYRRVETTVTTYGGRHVRAYVYLGIPSILDASCRPSERYRNILVRGATQAGLDARYIDRLRAVETGPPISQGPWTPPGDVESTFHPSDLAGNASLTALAGMVFDMSEARAEHDYLRKLFAGKDVTLLFLKRMDTSDGRETFDDVREDRLTNEQRAYLNAYLHEFAKEYRFVGALDYAAPSRSDVPVLGLGPRARTASLLDVGERGLSYGTLSSPPDGLVIAARAALARATAFNEAAGHENEGSLSVSHGYMPRHEPSKELPRSHEAWDQVVRELPNLYRTLGVRRAIEGLPVLSASEDALPDHALLRATQVLGFLSHAYHYVETRPPEAHPAALTEPWATIRKRLGRSGAVISYVDLIVNNWRFIDPKTPDPMRLENLQLLVPTVGNNEERIFYLTQSSILAHCSPIVNAVVRAQEAVVTDDRDVLESALVTITACLQRVLRESLLHINPNPNAADYVDPVVWAKTVAPFAVPIEHGVQGPSGTSSPIFNTLDIFFGRKRFETFLGKEIHQLRGTYPRFWREYLAALHEVSVPAYVGSRGSAHLQGLLHEAFQAYAGPNGFLGRHRMKVFGYLETAFKVGRSVTIGGFQGVFQDRTWDQVDTELERARTERFQNIHQTCFEGRVSRVEPCSPGGPVRLTLDVSRTGLRYEAGDRCGILPENPPSLVDRTLAALRATGDELVQLTPEWRELGTLRPQLRGKQELSLRELLTYGRIRPVLGRAAEALHAISQNVVLERAIREGRIESWELWDLLELLTKDGFDPRVLYAGDSGPTTTMCAVVPPESFRMYSITGVLGSAETDSASEVSLVVGRIAYEEPSGQQRRGTASAFLTERSDRETRVPVVIEHPPRFSLPRSARIPVVMIAGGTGVAPFLGFIRGRANQLAAARSWLVLCLRTAGDFGYGDVLDGPVRSGQLRLTVACSREDVTLAPSKGGPGFEVVPAKSRRVGDVLVDDANAQALWELLRPTSEGGGGAWLYVCGRTRFARAAIDALTELFARFSTGTPEERAAKGEQLFRQLSAEGRFMQEIFSGEGPSDDLPLVDASELARHNDEENGYWLAIGGRVFDITKYVHLHPGGLRIMTAYAGMEASEAYARAHGGRSEVDATRDMYACGRLRALELDKQAVEIASPTGPRMVALAGVFRAWLRQLYLVVEMQNALRNDQTLQGSSTTLGEPVEPRSPYRLQKAVETHVRFLRSYLDVLTTDAWPNLWQLTYGFVAATTELRPEEADAPDWLRERLGQIRSRPNARWAEAAVKTVDLAVSAFAEGEGGYERVLQACRVFEQEDMRLLALVKEKLRKGVRVFEEPEGTVKPEALAHLLELLKQVSAAVESYIHVVERRLSADAWVVCVDESAAELELPVEKGKNVLISTPHYVMEEDTAARVVYLRRSPLPFTSVEEIASANDGVINEIQPYHAEWGIVVDMRQAPARNDPGFENAMRRLRDTTTERFARLAVLLESTVGMLQVTRLHIDTEQRTIATMSETHALQFARGSAPTLPRFGGPT